EMDANLTALQLALLDAAAGASEVSRPVAAFKVGDTVVVSGSAVRSYTNTITTIGRKWIAVGEGRRAVRFDRSTLRSENGNGAGYSISSREQFAYDLMIGKAVEQLHRAG